MSSLDLVLVKCPKCNSTWFTNIVAQKCHGMICGRLPIDKRPVVSIAEHEVKG